MRSRLASIPLKRRPLHYGGIRLQIPSVGVSTIADDAKIFRLVWPFVNALHPVEADEFFHSWFVPEYDPVNFLKYHYPTQKNFMQAIEEFWSMDRRVAADWRLEMIKLAETIYEETSSVSESMGQLVAASKIELVRQNILRGQGFTGLTAIADDSSSQRPGFRSRWSGEEEYPVEGTVILRVIATPLTENYKHRSKRIERLRSLYAELQTITGESALMHRDQHGNRDRLGKIDRKKAIDIANKMALAKGITGQNHHDLMKMMSEYGQDRLLDAMIDYLGITSAFDYLRLVNVVWQNDSNQFFPANTPGEATRWLQDARILEMHLFEARQIRLAIEIMALFEDDGDFIDSNDTNPATPTSRVAAYYAPAVQSRVVVPRTHVVNQQFDYPEAYLTAWFEEASANDSYIRPLDRNHIQQNVRELFQRQMWKRKTPTIGLNVDHARAIGELRTMLRQIDPSFPRPSQLRREFERNKYQYILYQLQTGTPQEKSASEAFAHRPAFFEENWGIPADIGRVGEMLHPFIAAWYHYNQWEMSTNDERTAKIEEVMDLFYQDPALVLGAFFPRASDYLHYLDMLYPSGEIYTTRWLKRVRALELGELVYGSRHWGQLKENVVGDEYSLSSNQYDYLRSPSQRRRHIKRSPRETHEALIKQLKFFFR